MILSIDLFSWIPFFPINIITIILFLFTNPFFWALISMFGLVGATAVVSGINLGKNPIFGAIVVVIFGLGRIMLVLPFCPQPRFDMNGWEWVFGSIILAIGIVFGILPAFKVKPFTAPDEKIKLQTTGLYGITRNPIYLGEILFSLGASVMFQSIIGILLVPLWWAGLLIHTLIEEHSLESTLGQTYLDYKKKVRGRIIPGLPI